MIKRYWNSISLAGIQPDYDDKLIKRVTLTNQFCFVAITGYLISGINNLVMADTKSAVIITVFGIICLLGLFLNMKGYHRLAPSYLLFAVSSSIFYFDSYFGPDSGVYLYYFPLILAIAFLIDFKEKYLMIIHFLIPVIYIIINVFTGFSLFANEELSETIRHTMFRFNLPFCAATIGFLCTSLLPIILKKHLFSSKGSMNEKLLKKRSNKH